jgi:DNA-binding transcriptional ArsR family regulator
VTDNLTPTAQTTLETLSGGPATASELRERTGRSRSATDKALTELARAGLVVKVGLQDGAGLALWSLATTDVPPADDTLDPGEVDEPESGDDEVETPETESDAEQHGDSSREAQSDQDQPGAAPGNDPAVEVKVCRGCQDQMPAICPCCRQRTGAYCGTCRKDMPTARRRVPGEPEILANGLPKLTRGELERLVLDVMRAQPLPDHLGVTGWTSGRVAVFLPGRSTGAIGNVLDKLATLGQAHLLGEAPKRYQLALDTQPGLDRRQAHDEHPDAGPEPQSDSAGRPGPDAPQDDVTQAHSQR